MKVDDAMKKAASTSPTEVRQRQTTGAGAARTGASRTSGASSGSGSVDSAVNVSLSSQLSVMELAGDTEAFDVQKVDEIKAAIAGGQFHIDTGKVADGLIKTASELIRKPGD
ncbi:MAG: flagellar biosynthesis anti-sigma factor FlgM [Burkholderiaceae bacterium]|jgi:negative regulator of flagellin synthesis FlgM|nr:flagellar biosynthesis anti-sigma factor FlgM [Burkholderiaceae bacterium]